MADEYFSLVLCFVITVFRIYFLIVGICVSFFDIWLHWQKRHLSLNGQVVWCSMERNGLFCHFMGK